MKKQNNKILNFPTTLLSIIAHEDDEIITAGGTLIKNVQFGGKSHVICFGGSTSERAKEFQDSCKIMKMNSYELLKHKEGHKNLDRRETINYLRDKIIEYKPEFIITHRKEGDYHSDHQNVSDLAREATIKAQLPSEAWLTKGILYTESHSMHQTIHVLTDITNQYKTIIEALGKHKSQISKSKGYYKNLIDKKTALRGLQAGCERAEAFFYEPLPLICGLNKRNISS